MRKSITHWADDSALNELVAAYSASVPLSGPSIGLKKSVTVQYLMSSLGDDHDEKVLTSHKNLRKDNASTKTPTVKKTEAIIAV